MPLSKRTGCPYWWLTLGETVSESTRVRHEGRAEPQDEALAYERDRFLQYWDAKMRALKRAPVPTREERDAARYLTWRAREQVNAWLERIGKAER